MSVVVAFTVGVAWPPLATWYVGIEPLTEFKPPDFLYPDLKCKLPRVAGCRGLCPEERGVHQRLGAQVWAGVPWTGLGNVAQQEHAA